MFACFSGFQRKGTGKDDHGFEAVGLFILRFFQGFIATNGKRLVESDAVCSVEVIVEIPRFYPQGFAGVESLERVGGLETGQGEQAFIDDGNRIVHGFLVLFLDLYGKFFARTEFGGEVYDRFQPEFRVFDVDIDHAVHSHRTVVVLGVVGLNQGNGDIAVGAHLAGRLGFKGGCPFPGGKTLYVADGFSVFKTDKGNGAGGGGESDFNGFSDPVALFVRT